MKTIYMFLMFPFLVQAQTGVQHEIGDFNVEFSMDMDLETILLEEMDNATNFFDGTIELVITVEVYLEELFPEIDNSKTVFYMLPRYLNTFSLVGSYSDENKTHNPQNALNRSLAMNNSTFPKEDTLTDWLEPVRYQKNQIGRLQSTMEGFGPRISL